MKSNFDEQMNRTKKEVLYFVWDILESDMAMLKDEIALGGVRGIPDEVVEKTIGFFDGFINVISDKLEEMENPGETGDLLN